MPQIPAWQSPGFFNGILSHPVLSMLWKSWRAVFFLCINAKHYKILNTKNIWKTFHINDLSAGVLVKRRCRKNCQEFINAYCLNQSLLSNLQGMNFNQVYKEVSNDTPNILLSVCCWFAELLYMWSETRPSSICFLQVNPRLLCSLYHSVIHLSSLYSFSFQKFFVLLARPLISCVKLCLATPRKEV